MLLAEEAKSGLGGELIDGAARVIQDRLKGLPNVKKIAAEKFLSAQKATRVMLLVTMLAGTGCGSVSVPKFDPEHPDPTPIPTQPTPEKMATPLVLPPSPIVPTATKTAEISSSGNFERTIGKIRFTFSEEGWPLSYKNADGKQVFFDQKKLREARQKAITDKESKIFETIPLPEEKNSPSETSSKDHPVQKELPADVLSDEELAEKGIEIMQPDNTRLFIRKGVLEKGGPLADYAGGKYHLRIVLLNAPFVSDVFMSDPKYKEIKNIFLNKGSLREKPETKVEVEEYRQKQITQIQQMIEKLPQETKNGPLISLKVRLWEYQHKSKKALLEEIAHTDRLLGGIFTLGKRLPDGQTESIVIVAVGRRESAPQMMTIYYDSEGGINFLQTSGGYGEGSEPKSDQSYPDPASFRRNPDASTNKPWTYPYGAPTPGFALRHELKHDDFERGPQRRVNERDFIRPDGSFDGDAYFKFFMSGDEKGEYDTDEAAMDQIRAAWQKWRESGYKDDSGYYFIFRLPEGGYIFTKNEANSAKI